MINDLESEHIKIRILIPYKCKKVYLLENPGLQKTSATTTFSTTWDPNITGLKDCSTADDRYHVEKLWGFHNLHRANRREILKVIDTNR